jgi:hypothetical protein
MVCGVCLRRVSFIFSAANEDMTTKRVARASAAVPHEASFEAFFIIIAGCVVREGVVSNHLIKVPKKSAHAFQKCKLTYIITVQICQFRECAVARNITIATKLSNLKNGQL